MSQSADQTDDLSPSPPASLLNIFLLFFRIGIFSFGGGVIGWLYREVVEQRRWMTEADFLSGFTVCHVMPGVNVTNLAVYIGQRLKGVPGSVVAVAGVFIGPFFFVIGLFTIYAQVQSISWAPSFLSGVAASAVGLFLSVGIKSIRKNVTNIAMGAIMASIFIAVGILRWPMVWVVLCLAPVSVGLAWFNLKREQKDA
jgi:chromate transporter